MVEKVKRFSFFVVIAALLALLALPARAVEPDTPPVLTEAQRLQLQTLTQRIEIIQLRAQLLQLDFEHAKQLLTSTLATFAVPGYTLDLESMAYVPIATDKP